MLHDFGFFKFDGVIIYQNKPVGGSYMEQCTSTILSNPDLKLDQEVDTNNETEIRRKILQNSNG